MFHASVLRSSSQGFSTWHVPPLIVRDVVPRTSGCWIKPEVSTSFGLGFDTALLSAAWGGTTASNYLCSARSRSKQTIGATEP
jgi:hypothetical protein